MSGLEQYTLLMPIINQAVDFLFDEVKNILKERRDNRTHQKLNSGIKSNPATNKTELRDKSIRKENLIGDEAEELKHCIEQIQQHRKNRRMLEDQIGKYGGLISAPIHLKNQLDFTESEINNWAQKLKYFIEKIYDCDIDLD